ncbi:MAG: hypothetical protein AAFY38_00010 [Pseudomonadota bacterium]
MTLQSGLIVGDHRVNGTEEDRQKYIEPAIRVAIERARPEIRPKVAARRALLYEILEAMMADTFIHDFYGIDGLGTNIRFRVLTVEAMQAMSTGVIDADYHEMMPIIPACMGDCNNLRHIMERVLHPDAASVAEQPNLQPGVQALKNDDRFWTHQQGGPHLNYYSFYQTPGSNPSECIQHTNPFRGECAGAFQICVMRGFQETFDHHLLDRLVRRFGPLRVGPWHQTPRSNLPTPASALNKVVSVDPDYLRDTVIGVPGDYFYFRNKADYSDLCNGGWRGENCVYLGKDYLGQPHYSGLGLTGKTEFALRMFLENAYIHDCNAPVLKALAAAGEVHAKLAEGEAATKQGRYNHRYDGHLLFNSVEDRLQQLRFTYRGVLQVPDLEGPAYHGPTTFPFEDPQSDVEGGLKALDLRPLDDGVWSGTASQDDVYSAFDLRDENLVPFGKSSIAESKVMTQAGPWQITLAHGRQAGQTDVRVQRLKS